MAGMTRSLDELGRIVLPIEMRRALNLKSGDEITMAMLSGGILITPEKTTCAFCGAVADGDVSVIELSGRGICEDCLGIINATKAMGHD